MQSDVSSYIWWLLTKAETMHSVVLGRELETSAKAYSNYRRFLEEKVEEHMNVMRRGNSYDESMHILLLSIIIDLRGLRFGVMFVCL